MADVQSAPQAERLWKAVRSLKNTRELKRFLRDLLTEQEISEFSRRFRAAEMLYTGVPYSKIIKETKLSSTTVARISKWLHTGEGGYKIALNRLGVEPAQDSPYSSIGSSTRSMAGKYSRSRAVTK